MQSGNYEDFHTPVKERLVAQLAISKLLSRQLTFSEMASFMPQLWFADKRPLGHLLARRMAKRARSRQEWNKLKELTCNAGPRDVYEKAVTKVRTYARTFNDYRYLDYASRTQRRENIHHMRRLARTFKHWEEIYDQTGSPSDLQKMKEIGDLEDWQAVQVIAVRDERLLLMRNKILASYLAE